MSFPALFSPIFSSHILSAMFTGEGGLPETLSLDLVPCSYVANNIIVNFTYDVFLRWFSKHFGRIYIYKETYDRLNIVDMPRYEQRTANNNLIP